MTQKRRVAIFVSGSGTNMENIGRRVQTGELNCEITVVVCDKPEATALKRAENLGLPTFVIDLKKCASKVDYETKIQGELKRRGVELILLAGYMKIVGAEFVRAWAQKMINIHPSYLPKFPGGHAIQGAFDAKEKETGVTVHFVTDAVDEGPIILQRRVPIEPNDTLETLEARVHSVEYELYPEAIRLILAGKVKIKGNQVEILK